jgi:two-component system, LytTR family, response regulator AlgR
MSAMSELRVFIADDEAPARERLRELLGDIAQTLPTQVVGEARNGVEAIELLPASGAQVVLLDIQMPGMGGLEVARHLARLDAPPRIVFVTAHDRHAVEAFELNALDYLLKPVRAERLAAALRKARFRRAQRWRRPRRRRANTCRSRSATALCWCR